MTEKAWVVRQEGGQGKWAVDTAEENMSHTGVSDYRDDVTICFHFYNPQVRGKGLSSIPFSSISEEPILEDCHK